MRLVPEHRHDVLCDVFGKPGLEAKPLEITIDSRREVVEQPREGGAVALRGDLAREPGKLVLLQCGHEITLFRCGPDAEMLMFPRLLRNMDRHAPRSRLHPVPQSQTVAVFVVLNLHSGTKAPPAFAREVHRQGGAAVNKRMSIPFSGMFTIW